MKDRHPVETKAMQMLEHALDAGLAAAPDNLELLRVGYDAVSLALEMRVVSGALSGDEDPAAVDSSLAVPVLQLEVSSESDDLTARLVEVADRIAETRGVVVDPIDVLVNPQLSDAWKLNLYGDEVASGEPLDGPEAIQHIEDAIHRHLHELLSREMVADMLDGARRAAPMVVQELIPNMLSLGQLSQVLQALVRDYVSIRNMPLILNALADNAIYTKDRNALADHARFALGRSICNQYRSSDGILRCMQLHPAAQRLIENSIQLNELGQVLVLDPSATTQLVANIGDALTTHLDEPIVLMTSPKVRRHVQRLLRRELPELAVLSYPEIPDEVTTERVTTITIDATQIPVEPEEATDPGDINSMRW